jgi:glycine/D-amino acid oxidase-like deaminating enzyme
MSDAQAAQPRGSADYRQTSFWLETTPDDLVPRPRPRGDLNVDVAILGGGFSGLWTAYYLLRENPSLEIAIVERHIAGYGASGRNGGWCSPRFPVDPKPLMKNFGPDRARRTILALQESVRDIGDIVERESIDAHYVKGGLLSVAVGEHQLPSLQRTLDIYRRLGLGDGNRLLSADEARARFGEESRRGIADRGRRLDPSGQSRSWAGARGRAARWRDLRADRCRTGRRRRHTAARDRAWDDIRPQGGRRGGGSLSAEPSEVPAACPADVLDDRSH